MPTASSSRREVTDWTRPRDASSSFLRTGQLRRRAISEARRARADRGGPARRNSSSASTRSRRSSRAIGSRDGPAPSAADRPPADTPPRGLYIYGQVGRGKTFLMDMFFETARVSAKRRVHFHAFMADVHARIHRWRQLRKRGEVLGDDPIAPVAAALASEAALLVSTNSACATSPTR